MVNKHHISFRSFGVEISIETNHKDSISACRRLILDSFPECHEFTGSHPAEHHFRINWNPSGRDSLYKDGQRIVRSMRREGMLAILQSRLRLTVAEFSEDFVFLHAGAVAWKGSAIIIPGYSLQGKSTLVAELVKRGAIYYSDDFAILDKDGWLHPFPKTLSLRGQLPNLQQVEHEAAAFGAVTGSQRVKIGRVLFTSFKPNAKWHPETVSSANGMIELIKNSISIRRNPQLVLGVLKKIASEAVFIKTDRGEASDAANSILKFE